MEENSTNIEQKKQWFSNHLFQVSKLPKLNLKILLRNLHIFCNYLLDMPILMKIIKIAKLEKATNSLSSTKLYSKFTPTVAGIMLIAFIFAIFLMQKNRNTINTSNNLNSTLESIIKRNFTLYINDVSDLALIVNIKSLCSIKPNSYSIGDAITNAINNNLKISSLLEALSIHPEDFSHFIYGKNDSTGETIYLLAGSFDVSRINKRLPNLMNLLFKIDINTTNHGTCQIHQIKLNNDDGAPIFYFAVVDTNTCVLSESKNMILTSLRQTDNIYPINSGKYLRQMVDKADLRLPASLLDPLDDAIRNGLVVATRYHKGLASDTILTLVGQGGLLGTMEYRGLNQKQLEELDVLIDNDFTKIKLDAEQNVKEITQTLIELEQKTGFSISSFFGYENIEQTIKGIIFGCKIRKRILDNSLFVDMFIPWKNNHN